MSKALIIVDVQPTFCEGGELPVEGGNAVAERIAEYVRENPDSYDVIVTTQDWHIDPGEHFSDTPDFVDSWPPHGVAGSENAALHPAIANLDADVVFKKGQYAAAYSGFEARDGLGNSPDEILAYYDIDEVHVVGLAQSHCVKETALDAVRLDYETVVITDLTAPVSKELGEAAEAQMRDAGVQLRRSGL